MSKPKTAERKPEIDGPRCKSRALPVSSLVQGVSLSQIFWSKQVASGLRPTMSGLVLRAWGALDLNNREHMMYRKPTLLKESGND